MSEPRRLTFGIYPGMTGCEPLHTGPFSDDPERTNAALDRLQGGGPPLLVRAYALYVGSGRVIHQSPADLAAYASGGRRSRATGRYCPLSRSPRSRTTPTPRPAGMAAPLASGRR